LSGLSQETPISMKMLNYNIDSDLIFNTYFSSIKKTVNTGTLGIYGGKDNSHVWVNLDALIGKVQILNGYLDMQFNRVVNLGTPTTDGDALPFKNWADYSPSPVWTGGTPASLTTVARWVQIGKTVFIKVYFSSADSNACTNLSFSAPVAGANTGGYAHFAARQTYNGTLNATISFFLNEDGASTTIATTQFNACTDGQNVKVILEGFYEVA
jgi:hypothetical protein